MTEREAIAYIEQWDVTEAAKVLKWYEDNELLRPCDCDTMIAIETESLRDENAKLRELIVRCCDCESAREHYEGMDVWWCGFLAMYVGSGDFCCWGKRREGA